MRVRILVPNSPDAAAGDDHSVPGSKGPILPDYILPVGCIAELAVALPGIWKVL